MTSRSKLGNVYPKADIEASHDQFHAELRTMYKRVSCADCCATPANWATLSRGTFVCVDCAQKLRADAANRVKSCMGTYLWHPDEMEVMRSKT